jgi:hypothetical protein
VRVGPVLETNSTVARARRFSRGAAVTATALAVVTLVAGCNFISPQRTTKIYDASDGTSITVGDVKVRNAIALTDGGSEASLVMSVINDSDDAVEVSFQYETSAGDETQTVEVDARSQVDRGTSTDDDQFVMSDLDVTPGQLLPVFIQYGTETGKTLQVPVLTGDLPEYATLLPTPTPTGTTVEPGESSTPLPESDVEESEPSPSATADR